MTADSGRETRASAALRWIVMSIQHPVVSQVEQQLQLLFSRCPELSGFSVRGDAEELFISDVGIAPRLSAEQYGEIYQDIAATLAELVEERPEACELLRGRTFARTLH
jgi:hypothetical protein